MRIVCPSCEATYNVPDAKLGAAPRQVRCVKCSTVWTVDPPHPAFDPHDDAHLPLPIPITPIVAEPHDAPPPIAATDRLPTTHKASGGTIAPAIAWLVSLAVLVAAAWTVVAWRVPIMQAWAPSRRLFQWLGLG